MSTEETECGNSEMGREWRRHFRIGTGGEEFVNTKRVLKRRNGAPNWHNFQIYMRLRRRLLPLG